MESDVQNESDVEREEEEGGGRRRGDIGQERERESDSDVERENDVEKEEEEVEDVTQVGRGSGSYMDVIVVNYFC